MLAASLIGCVGLSTQAAEALKQSEPFQQQLTHYQVQLKQSSALPAPERVKRVTELLGEVQKHRQQLRQLSPQKHDGLAQRTG